MAGYPEEIFDPRQMENLPGLVRDPLELTILYAEDYNELSHEVVVIEEILGVAPYGEFDTVGEFLQYLLERFDEFFISGNLELPLEKRLIFRVPDTTSRDSRLMHNSVQDDFAQLGLYPENGTNVASSFIVSPRGTGIGSSLRSQFVIYNTDYNSDKANWERLRMFASSADFQYIVEKLGTGTLRPIIFLVSGNANQLHLAINGNIGMGGVPNANAKLDIQSTTKAFMPPRMTTTQKNAIASPTNGMVVFDTTLGKLSVYSTTWQTITSV